MAKAKATKTKLIVAHDGEIISTQQAQEKVVWYADAIAGSWRSTVASIIETARLIVEADEDILLTEGDKKELAKQLQSRGIGPATTSKLRQIAGCKLFKEEDYNFLPPSYNHLYEMSSEKLAPKYQTIIKRLSSGEDFGDIRSKLTKKTGRAATKGNQETLILSVSADLGELTEKAASKIEAFIASMKRTSHVSVRVTPKWNKYTSNES